MITVVKKKRKIPRFSKIVSRNTFIVPTDVTRQSPKHIQSDLTLEICSKKPVKRQMRVVKGIFVTRNRPFFFSREM